MNRSYGHLALVDGSQWVMRGIAPHVAIRLKQLFPRIPKWVTDEYFFPNDLAHCADLSWFTTRYPLTISPADAAALDWGRQSFEREQARMEEILRPEYSPSETVGLRPGCVIRHYQSQAVDLTLARKSLLLGDDVGLGKTYTAAALILHMETRPAAVVVQTHLQRQWAEKLGGFTDLTIHCIKGTRPYDLPPADVYIFKYSQLLGWIDTFQNRFFKAAIFDEIQELRTGAQSGKGQAAHALANSVQYRLGLSATPIYNYGVELWNIMQAVDPGLLGNHEEFMREWTDGDKKVKDPQALGTYLREQKVFLRRTKRDVGQQMPPLNVIVEEVGSDSETLRSVEQLARQLAIRTTEGSFMERGRAGRELDLLMRRITGVAKARFVAQYARLLLEADVPVMLMGWHRDVYDIWLRELADFNPVMYTGSESDKQKNEAKEAFVSGKTNLFIMSLRSGAGLDGLQYRCSTVIFGELDWSPKIHEQVIGRLEREGQEEQVTAIYLNSDDGSDPPMVELLGLKASQSSGIVDPNAPLTQRHSDKSRIQALAEQFLKRKAAA
ncbi:DEAD/DEAH box helicase [Pseudomonas stutzeri]|nr:DEAD/DEAH box helicase [Stutzerimonas stutzeri]